MKVTKTVLTECFNIVECYFNILTFIHHIRLFQETDRRNIPHNNVQKKAKTNKDKHTVLLPVC